MAGAVFPTASHPGRPPAGIGLIQEVQGVSDKPLLAIGGITPDRLQQVVAAGAHGAAVRGGIWGARDPGDAVRVYLQSLEDVRRGAS
jgi:thiamine monophosphate synthase